LLRSSRPFALPSIRFSYAHTVVCERHVFLDSLRQSCLLGSPPLTSHPLPPPPSPPPVVLLAVSHAYRVYGISRVPLSSLSPQRRPRTSPSYGGESRGSVSARQRQKDLLPRARRVIPQVTPSADTELADDVARHATSAQSLPAEISTRDRRRPPPPPPPPSLSPDAARVSRPLSSSPSTHTRARTHTHTRTHARTYVRTHARLLLPRAWS